MRRLFIVRFVRGTIPTQEKILIVLRVLGCHGHAADIAQQAFIEEYLEDGVSPFVWRVRQGTERGNLCIALLRDADGLLIKVYGWHRMYDSFLRLASGLVGRGWLGRPKEVESGTVGIVTQQPRIALGLNVCHGHDG